MNDFDLDKFLNPRVRVMQIIVLALVMGVLTFLGVAVLIRSGPNPPNPANGTAPLLTYMGIGFAGLMVVLHFLLRIAVAKTRRQIARGTWMAASRGSPLSAEELSRMGDAEKLCLVYQTRLIVGAAMLEGAAFFNLIAYITEGELVSPVVAGLLVALLLARLPTRDRVERFLSEQGELLRQERQAV